MTGTSISGPTTVANAAPLSIPKVATATAIANLKLFEAAVLRSANRSPPFAGLEAIEVEPTRIHSPPMQPISEKRTARGRADSANGGRQGHERYRPSGTPG